MLAPSAAPQIGDCLLAFPFYITEYFFTKKKKRRRKWSTDLLQSNLFIYKSLLDTWNSKVIWFSTDLTFW